MPDKIGEEYYGGPKMWIFPQELSDSMTQFAISNNCRFLMNVSRSNYKFYNCKEFLVGNMYKCSVEVMNEHAELYRGVKNLY